MKKDVVAVEIRGILPANSGCAIFVGNEEKVFVIQVEHNMGAVIGMFLRDTPKERPLTHDLIASIFSGFNITVERVVITELKNSTYFARLILQQHNERARESYEQWCADLGSMDHEKIDAAVSHSGEALKAVARLREALQTLPFFGSGKAVWFQNCSFLGDDRAASSAAVTEMMAELAQELKGFSWKDVRLLISAAKLDKRKTFYKTIEKIGTVETYAGLSIDDRDWAGQAEAIAL